jgi:hypothetical protein
LQLKKFSLADGATAWSKLVPSFELGTSLHQVYPNEVFDKLFLIA